MKKPLIFVLFCYSITMFSQKNEYKNIFSFSTVSVNFGRVDVGYMHQLNKKIWLGTELGYGSGYFLFSDEFTNSKNSNEFKISPEIYFDISPDSKWLNLFSIQLFYSNRKVQKNNSNFYQDSEYYSFTSADFEKTRQGINFNYSFLVNRNGNKFAIMPKIGLGLRKKNIVYTNIEGLEMEPSPVDDFTLGLFRPEAGSSIGLNFNFDVKLIYRF